MAPYKGLKVITYHRSWANFADAFGLDVVGYVEPKPGIPPTPQHTLDVINAMKAQNVKLILVEPYFDLKTPNAIARDSGGKVLGKSTLQGDSLKHKVSFDGRALKDVAGGAAGGVQLRFDVDKDDQDGQLYSFTIDPV